MPFNGKLVEWDALSYGVTSAVDAALVGSGPFDVGHEAGVETRWVPDVVQLVPGIQLTVTAGTTGWQVEYVGPGPGGGVHTETGTGWRTEVSGEVRLRGVRLYARELGSLLRLTAEAVELRVNGLIRETWGPLDVQSQGCGPGYVPLIGYPARVWGSCAGSGYTGPGSYDWMVTLEQLVSGGWRFRETEFGEWQTLPVRTLDLGVPEFDGAAGEGDCGGGPNPAGIVVSTATWGPQLALRSVEAEERTCGEAGFGPATGSTERRVGHVTLAPDLGRSVERLNADYRGLWVRYGFPRVEVKRERTCGVVPPSALVPPVTQTWTEMVYPGLGQRIAGVDAAVHPMEMEVFEPVKWAPCVAAASLSQRSVPASGCDAGAIFTSGRSRAAEVVFPSFVEERGDAAAYLSHADGRVRWWQSWGAPHWSLFWYRGDWRLRGAMVPYAEYWGPGRVQWIEHPSLPESERVRTRTDLVSEPLETSAHTPFLNQFTGGQRWVGISRWHMDGLDAGDETAYDVRSADLVTVEGGSWTAGIEGLTVNPTGERVTVRIRWADGTTFPYLWPQIARQVRVDWDGAGVLGARVWLESEDGDGRTELEGESGDWRTIFLGRDRSYAGTWALDNGMGVVTVLGIDQRPGGRSTTVSTGPWASAQMGLLAHGGAGTLVIEIETDGGFDPVEIAWPRLRTSGVCRWVGAETSQVQMGLWATNPDGRGPGVRFGQWEWVGPAGLRTVPVVRGLGSVPTVVDWLCGKRLWRGQERSEELLAEIGELYDAYEGQSVGGAARNSLAFLWPQEVKAGWRLAAALVNTASEIPPLALFPVRGRSETGLATGDWCERTWSWAQESRAWAGRAAIDVRVAGETWTEPWGAGVPEGWTVSRVRRAVTGDEENDAEVVALGRVWAKVSPWHGGMGAFTVFGEGGGVAADAGPGQEQVRGTVREGRAAVDFSDVRLGVWRSVDSGVDAGEVAVRWDGSERGLPVLLLVTGETGVRRVLSRNLGEDWSDAVVIRSGVEARCPSLWVSRDGTTLAVWAEAETVWGARFDRSGALMGAAAALSGVSGEGVTGLAVTERTRGGGEREWVLQVAREDGVEVLVSGDGATWVTP